MPILPAIAVLLSFYNIFMIAYSFEYYQIHGEIEAYETAQPDQK